ncbi:Cas9 inhibitor AcrIIA9 family protein [Fodinibius sp.]|uniref:Cas9 inhibitor AcrIIA9 family protein n=1 Tax=Fodinibius sp. TaxID=1872440 RepID=UPI002ACD3A8C|nr:Cas9 inhibitor AcrIIA9 family protein [Fodinibius sp.]MDZ7658056.1 Cas9 inhibitor AcrIIA9 family protein [Fodinibius sp.]
MNLAAHYYDEDDLDEADPIDCNVVVNHKPELSDEEKEELREKARKKVMREERQRLHSKKRKSTKKEQEDEQPNLFSS